PPIPTAPRVAHAIGTTNKMNEQLRVAYLLRLCILQRVGRSLDLGLSPSYLTKSMESIGSFSHIGRPAAPRPVLRMTHLPFLHRIRMHVVQLLLQLVGVFLDSTLHSNSFSVRPHEVMRRLNLLLTSSRSTLLRIK